MGKKYSKVPSCLCVPSIVNIFFFSLPDSHISLFLSFIEMLNKNLEFNFTSRARSRICHKFFYFSIGSVLSYSRSKKIFLQFDRRSLGVQYIDFFVCSVHHIFIYAMWQMIHVVVIQCIFSCYFVLLLLPSLCVLWPSTLFI